MDVTFREIESCFSTIPSPLQGEDNEREEMIPSPITSEHLTLEETTIQGETNGDQEKIIVRLDKPDLRRYSRRDKTEAKKAIVQPTQCQ